MKALWTLTALALLASPAALAAPDDDEGISARHAARKAADGQERSNGLTDAHTRDRRPSARRGGRHSTASGARRPSTVRGRTTTTTTRSTTVRRGSTAPTTQARRPLARPAANPPPRPTRRGAPPPRTTTTRTVVVRSRPTVRVARVRPASGVFVYGPRPVHHVHYTQAPPTQQEVEVQVEHVDERKVDRARTWALGLTTGSMVSGYRDGTVYGDFGLGAIARYRPAEALGLELQVSHHNESWGRDTERAQTTGQLSGQLFVTPWNRFSPYLTGGLTLTAKHHDEGVDLGGDLADGGAKSVLFGPHGGVGVEIALGERWALDLDARFAGYVNRGTDRVSPAGAFTGGVGIVTHF